MSDTERLEQALVAADAAGDVEAARRLAQALREAREPTSQKEAQPSEPEPQRGMSDEIMRQLGLTGRAVAGGAAQMLEPFDAPVRYMLNKALPGDPFMPLEQATDQALTQAGVPEPETATERGVQDVGRFVTGMGGGMGLANRVDDAVLSAVGLARHATPVATPTTSQLRRQAQALYKEADEAGVAIAPESFKKFAYSLGATTKKLGMDKDIQPKATAALRRITETADSGQPVSLEDLEILRRVATASRSSTDASEQMLGSRIVEGIDDFIGSIGNADVVAGDPRAASAMLSGARDAWSRMARSESIQEAIEKAGIRAGQFSGSGFENALRTQFRQIAMNNKRMRGFSKAEQEAIKKVASGGPIDNAFRYLGKLAPTGVVPTGAGVTLGYAAAGPAGAAAVPAIGLASRRVATHMTKRNADDVGEMVRRGMANPKTQPPDWLLPWLSGATMGADTQGEE